MKPILKRRALAGAVVVLLHGLLIAAAWMPRAAMPRREDNALMVALLRTPAPTHDDAPPPPVPERLVASLPVVLVDTAPSFRIPVADAAPAPVTHTAAPSPGTPAVDTLATELAVQCPERTPPRYPPLAKRQREQGEVRLRVELDESGRIERVTVVSSSGSPRLDEAARAAIQSWRCRPAQHDGQPVRAVALQSLAFVLERH